MIEPIRTGLDALAAAIRRGRSVNVNDQSTKDRVITLTTQYFNDCRPVLVQRVGESTELGSLDSSWQDLVRLAHGNNARASYRRRLQAIRNLLNELSVASMAKVPSAEAAQRISAEETRLLETLEQLLPTAAASYRQAVSDLLGPPRHSYRGTATELREALRETLDHLAPDADVTQQPGFKFEDGQKAPTMKQKVRFVLAARGRSKTQRDSTEKSAALVDDLRGAIARAVYNRASVATHTQESLKEVRRLKRYVDTVLAELLEVE